ncbi:MAG: alpha/beta hydrolase [Alphaproteobacteria bacterium]|nr:alpha/beta hydrolase [Alphaproteobacteria bacterium]
MIFCTGFKSDMTGGKALALEAWCRTEGRQFTRFDYQGHGASSGDFAEGTIGLWLDDALAVLDEVARGGQVIVGSSMGGWIALLMARARPDRVRGLVTIAAAVDMTEELIWRHMPQEIRDRIETEGVWMRPSDYGDGPYPITKALIEDGRNHLLLPGPIPFEGPVRLLHGKLDDSVPWRHSRRVAEALRSRDVEVVLVEDGEHRLSRDEDLQRILAAVSEVLEHVHG